MKLIFTLPALALVLAAPAASAAVIVNDSFNDGGRTNGTDPNDASWYTGKNITTLSVTSNKLSVDPSATFGFILGNFSNTTIAVGERLQLSVDLTYVSAPVDLASGLRVGLYYGSPQVTNEDNGRTGHYGYAFGSNPGLASASGTNVFYENSGDNILGSTNGLTAVGSPVAGQSIVWGTSTHSFLYSITRNANGSLSVSASIDGNTAATGSLASPLNNNYTFNTIAIGQGSMDVVYTIDNVLLQTVTVPEPASALLGSLGCLLLLRRRRA